MKAGSRHPKSSDRSHDLNYRYSDLGDLQSALRDGTTSSVEIAHEALRLLADLAPTYNALANLLPERAIADAERADRRLRRGDSSRLCGIPYAAKDLFAARGGPTSWGSSTFADQVIDQDADVVSRLAKAGAVLVAKTSMSELAGGGRPAKPGASMHGSGINPWASDRYSGGSSSGSAIAVALGLVPYGLGTETGGSVLGPAAYSGVTGIRPTAGNISKSGAMTLSWTLDKIGVLARTAKTCADVLAALLDHPWRRRFRKELANPLEPRGLRMGVSPSIIDECSPGIRPAIEKGLGDLEELGVALVETELSRDSSVVDAVELIIQVEGAHEFAHWLRAGSLDMTDEKQLANLKRGLEVLAMDYLDALRQTTAEARRSFDGLFAEVDVVVAASRVDDAPHLDRPRAPRDPNKQSDLLRAAGNLAGVPGVSMPCGLSVDGLPVGLQIVGARNSEATLLRLTALYQSATNHHERRPPERTT